MSAPSPAVTPGTGVPILLVDDNASKRLALKAILAPLGHRVVEVESGLDALRCVMAEDFAMILLDVYMPNMDGLETATLIRQRRQSQMTPIIFITAHGADEIDRAAHYLEGAVDFIFAPVAPTELRAKVTAFANLFARAEDLAARAEMVQRSADQLRLLTDAAPIGIFRTDAEKRYLSTNPRWSELTGITAEDARGRPWDIFLGAEVRSAPGTPATDDSTEPVVLDQDRSIDANSELCRRFELRRAGAPLRIVLLTWRPVPDTDGGNAGWIGTLADITAEANAEVAMSEARDAALDANAMQINFTASASHELKTPTTSILGFLEEVLESDTLVEQDRAFLDIVYRNAQRLSRLIDDLLILGEAEIDASMMNFAPMSLKLLVSQVMSDFSPAAHEANVELILDEHEEFPSALGDPQRTEQVLANLISNAVKFTPNGGTVTIGLHADGEMAGVSVADTGMGIAPEDLERIFGRFFRTDVAVDSAVKGTGLGLAIAKRMVEAQGGELLVTSSLGVGSTFTMTLPAALHFPEVVVA